MRSTWFGGDRPITQPWGCTDVAAEPYDARFPGCAHFHEGIDIGWIDATDQQWLVSAGLPGLRVVASYIITLPYAESLLRLTNDVHDFWLFHGSQHLVNVGDRPALDTPLMHVGAIGIAAGPHLHFEVRPAGSPYQPFNSVAPDPFLQPLPEASERPYSPGGNMALAPHPTIPGRVDEFVVGTNGHVYHLGGDVAAATPGVEDWGGKAIAGGVSGAWMPDGQSLVCSAVGPDGGVYRRSINLDGSVKFDWFKIQNAAALLPVSGVGPAGPVGPQGPIGPAGPKGDPGAALTTVPVGTVLKVQ